MTFFRRPEFFSARDVNEIVELFPALNVGFNLSDQLVEFFGGHKCGRVVIGEKAACGNRKMMAPPRNSRAVMWRLAKWMLTSASGIRAALASRNRDSTSCPMSRTNSFGKADETVYVTTRPLQSTAIPPAGSCWTAARERKNRFKNPMTKQVFCFFPIMVRQRHWAASQRENTRFPGSKQASDVPNYGRRRAKAARLRSVPQDVWRFRRPGAPIWRAARKVACPWFRFRPGLRAAQR